MDHSVLCRSDDKRKGLGYHITPNRQCPQDLGFPGTTKIKSNTLYLITEPAFCWRTFHLTADLRKNTVSEIGTTKAGYLVYKEVEQIAAEKGSLAWSSIVADEEMKWKKLLEKRCVWW